MLICYDKLNIVKAKNIVGTKYYQNDKYGLYMCNKTISNEKVNRDVLIFEKKEKENITCK